MYLLESTAYGEPFVSDASSTTPLNSTPDHGAVTGPESIPIDPAILYWGTPVVLVSTVNEDGAPNLAPM
jgi:hypothetical protein